MLKRKSAAQLVGDATCQRSGTGTWFDAIGPVNQLYMRDIVREVVEQPGVAIYLVAGELKEELDLTVHVNTIVLQLKRMIRDEEKTKR